MDLVVNGKSRLVESPQSLLGLLQVLGIDPRIVAVEHNGEIVKRDRFGETTLSSGDRLEIVRMVGGGSEHAPPLPPQATPSPSGSGLR